MGTALPGRFCRQHGGLVIGGGFPLLKGDGACMAGRQAVAQTITIMLMHQLGLTVHQRNSAFVTGVDTGAAAVALFLVDMNDLADHEHDLLVVF